MSGERARSARRGAGRRRRAARRCCRASWPSASRCSSCWRSATRACSPANAAEAGALALAAGADAARRRPRGAAGLVARARAGRVSRRAGRGAPAPAVAAAGARASGSRSRRRRRWRRRERAPRGAPPPMRARGPLAAMLAAAAAWLLEPARAGADRAPARPRPRPVVAVFGLARGCGATVVARALAAELARRDVARRGRRALRGRPAGIPLATPAAGRLARAARGGARRATPARWAGSVWSAAPEATRWPTPRASSRRSCSTPARPPSAASPPRWPTESCWSPRPPSSRRSPTWRPAAWRAVGHEPIVALNRVARRTSRWRAATSPRRSPPRARLDDPGGAPAARRAHGRTARLERPRAAGRARASRSQSWRIAARRARDPAALAAPGGRVRPGGAADARRARGAARGRAGAVRRSARRWAPAGSTSGRRTWRRSRQPRSCGASTRACSSRRSSEGGAAEPAPPLERGVPRARAGRGAARRAAQRRRAARGSTSSFPGGGFAPTRVDGRACAARRGSRLARRAARPDRRARAGGRRDRRRRGRRSACPAQASGGGYDGPLAYRQGKPMRPDVAAAFDRMAAAARARGGADAAGHVAASAPTPSRRGCSPRTRTRSGSRRRASSLHRYGTELDLGPPAAYGWLAANAGGSASSSATPGSPGTSATRSTPGSTSVGFGGERRRRRAADVRPGRATATRSPAPPSAGTWARRCWPRSSTRSRASTRSPAARRAPRASRSSCPARRPRWGSPTRSTRPPRSTRRRT